MKSNPQNKAKQIKIKNPYCIFEIRSEQKKYGVSYTHINAFLTTVLIFILPIIMIKNCDPLFIYHCKI